MRATRRLGAVVAVNLLVTASHGAVHATIPVVIRGWQSAVVGVTIVAGPILAVGLFARGHEVAAVVLGALSGLGALAFEGLFHFVEPNPDHVGHVTHDAALFATTAGLSTLGDGLFLAAIAWVAHESVSPDLRSHTAD